MFSVASETGHVYAFATNKLKPLICGDPGKSLIQSCLNAPDSKSFVYHKRESTSAHQNSQ